MASVTVSAVDREQRMVQGNDGHQDFCAESVCICVEEGRAENWMEEHNVHIMPRRNGCAL